MTKDIYQQKGYAPVNGLNIYYEIHGSGEPLVLLPGGFMTVEAMGEIVPATCRDASCHRRRATRAWAHLRHRAPTALRVDGRRHRRPDQDISALNVADIFGYSLGGAVGLQTAIRHPEMVRKLALASTAFKRDGWYPEVLAGMASISVETFAGTPIHETYLKTSPRPEAWPTFVARMRQLLSEDYDWTEDVAALTVPILIMVGDADGVRIPHAVELFGLLGGGKADGDLAGLSPSQLAVLPATTHVGWASPYHGIMNRTGLLLPIITEFLDSPIP